MLTGSICALITPFTFESKINYIELEKILDFHLENRTDGILLLGTTGESEALTLTEKEELVRFCLDYLNGRIKVMVGVIGNNFDEVKGMIDVFDNFNFDSYLVVTPFYVKGNNSGIIKYFNRIADYANHPIIIYNVPKRTGINLDLEIVKCLSYHKNIIGIKEASGDLGYQTKIASFCNDEFVLYGGDDLNVLGSLSLGAKGIISVINNAFPKEFKLIISSFSKNIDISRTLLWILLPIIEAIYIEVSPIGIKYLMYLLGFDTDKYRLPLDEPDKKVKRIIEEKVITYLGD